jgi:hypothetical protein
MKLISLFEDRNADCENKVNIYGVIDENMWKRNRVSVYKT